MHDECYAQNVNCCPILNSSYLKTFHRMCIRNYALKSWEETVPAFKYSPAVPFSENFAPTIDTGRFGALLSLALQVRRPILLTGTHLCTTQTC